MFIVDLFIIPPNWKQSKCPSVGNTLWYIHTMDEIFIKKKKEKAIETYSDLDRSQGNYAEWGKKSQFKRLPTV